MFFYNFILLNILKILYFKKKSLISKNNRKTLIKNNKEKVRKNVIFIFSPNLLILI